MLDKEWEGVVRRLERQLEKATEEGIDFIPVTTLRSGQARWNYNCFEEG